MWLIEAYEKGFACQVVIFCKLNKWITTRPRKNILPCGKCVAGNQ